MKNTFLVITSIASQEHPVLRQFAKESGEHQIPFIVVGDTKSPIDFHIEGCDFYSVERQQSLDFELAKQLPVRHYARKNLGYLIAMKEGAEVIIETDDDNIPLENFWAASQKEMNAHLINGRGWVNVYKYFTDKTIWPRGFDLEKLQEKVPAIAELHLVECPIQQGLADENPDVDAIYRLTQPLPLFFNNGANIALGNGSVCPFNSQNTTWFKEAFLLMYLPSYCSFRMTDIWRSFVAQRIAWSCGWPILFHNATVRQERNDHNLTGDFGDEISGYLNNGNIVNRLMELNLKEGVENIAENMLLCYKKLIQMKLVGKNEIGLLRSWLSDVPFLG